MANSLQFILRQIQSGSTVIVLSDFCSLDNDAEQYLRLIAHKCELINLLVYDPLEASLPDRGYLALLMMVVLVWRLVILCKLKNVMHNLC